MMLLLIPLAILLHVISRIVTWGGEVVYAIKGGVMLLTLVAVLCGIILVTSKPITRLRIMFLFMLSVIGVAELLYLIKLLLLPSFNIPVNNITPWSMLYSSVYSFFYVLYPIEILRPYYFTLRRSILLALPLLLYAAVVSVVSFVPMPHSYFVKSSEVLVSFGYMLSMLYPLVTLLYAFRVGRFLNRWTLENFSDFEAFGSSWVRDYLLAYLSLHASFVVCFFSFTPNISIIQTILHFVFVIFVIVFALRQESHLPQEADALIKRLDEEMFEEHSTVYVESGANSLQEIYQERLQHYLEQKRPYLDPSFRLTDLCEALQINRLYALRLLNGENKERFYDLVERYRIAYSKELMQGDPSIKVADLAHNSGFRSVGVFVRAFRRAEGVAPREYLKRLRAHSLR